MERQKTKIYKVRFHTASYSGELLENFGFSAKSKPFLKQL